MIYPNLFLSLSLDRSHLNITTVDLEDRLHSLWRLGSNPALKWINSVNLGTWPLTVFVSSSVK